MLSAPDERRAHEYVTHYLDRAGRPTARFTHEGFAGLTAADVAAISPYITEMLEMALAPSRKQPTHAQDISTGAASPVFSIIGFLLESGVLLPPALALAAWPALSRGVAHRHSRIGTVSLQALRQMALAHGAQSTQAWAALRTVPCATLTREGVLRDLLADGAAYGDAPWVNRLLTYMVGYRVLILELAQHAPASVVTDFLTRLADSLSEGPPLARPDADRIAEMLDVLGERGAARTPTLTPDTMATLLACRSATVREAVIRLTGTLPQTHAVGA